MRRRQLGKLHREKKQCHLARCSRKCSICGHPVPVLGKKVRVVGTNGSLTGYAGGIDKKIALLELEHTNMSDFFVPKKGTTL